MTTEAEQYLFDFLPPWNFIPSYCLPYEEKNDRSGNQSWKHWSASQDEKTCQPWQKRPLNLLWTPKAHSNSELSAWFKTAALSTNSLPSMFCRLHEPSVSHCRWCWVLSSPSLWRSPASMRGPDAAALTSSHKPSLYNFSFQFSLDDN